MQLYFRYLNYTIQKILLNIEPSLTFVVNLNLIVTKILHPWWVTWSYTPVYLWQFILWITDNFIRSINNWSSFKSYPIKVKKPQVLLTQSSISLSPASNDTFPSFKIEISRRQTNRRNIFLKFGCFVQFQQGDIVTIWMSSLVLEFRMNFLLNNRKSLRWKLLPTMVLNVKYAQLNNYVGQTYPRNLKHVVSVCSFIDYSLNSFEIFRQNFVKESKFYF